LKPNRISFPTQKNSRERGEKLFKRVRSSVPEFPIKNLFGKTGYSFIQIGLALGRST
jgi:hypothetical protein